MFDQYTRNQRRSRMNWPLFVLVIGGILVGGWLVLQAKERHDVAEMNSLFESMPSSPPREIAQGKPTLQQLPGMSVEVMGELALTGDYDHGDASRGDTWKISWTPNTKLAAAA